MKEKIKQAIGYVKDHPFGCAYTALIAASILGNIGYFIRAIKMKR